MKSALSEEHIREIASLKKRTDEVVAVNTTKIVLPKVAHLPVNLPKNTNLIEFPSEDQDVVLETALHHINAHRKFGASIEKSTQVLDEADNIRSGKQDSDKKIKT